MPTPSNNGPDPHPQSPRPYLFSTCPDPDEQNPAIPDQPQTQSAHPPTSWRQHAPPFPVPGVAAMDEDAGASRSATMSPAPQPREAQDHDRGEPEGMVASQTDTDDSQKPTDTDEDMVVGGATGEGGSVHADGRGPIQDGVSPRRTGRRSTAGESSRRRQVPEPSAITSVDVGHADGSELATSGGPPWVDDTSLLGLGYEYADTRVIPVSPSSFLRPGSRFHGTQQSERQRYDVQVEIKHVDLRESFLCGYLRIQGLTDDHPTLTTYFEGEIIGNKYGFKTQHPSWGASDKDDLSHWAKFAAFRPFSKQARKGGQVLIKDVAQRENIFMRWKEHFLVPDHRIRTIIGASFEGFYYICFNQVRGEVSGIYFHKSSEKFQQLELKHIPNKGCYGAMEFR